MSMNDKSNTVNCTNVIYLWKIVFTFLIIYFHITWNNRWYLGVEFFFIVSGYLLAKDFFQKKDEPLSYLVRRIKNIYPYYLIGFILGLFVMEKPFNFNNVLLHFPELFCIQGCGFFRSDDLVLYNGPDWYISALFATSFILYFFLTKFKQEYIKYYAPFICLFIYSYNYNATGSISSFGFPIGGHIARAMAAMNLGIIAYGLSNHFSNYSLTKCQKSLALFASTLLLTLSIFLSYDINYPKLDYLCVILFFISIMLAFLVPLSTKLINNKLIAHLNDITILLFLNHYTLLRLPINRTLFFILLFFVADVEYLIVKFIKKRCLPLLI